MIELEKYYVSNDGLYFYVHSAFKSQADNNRSYTAYVIIVFADTGYLRICSVSDIEKGDVSPYYKHGGYMYSLDISEFLEMNKNRKAKSIWLGMINRCYSGVNKAYDNVSVCKEWHNFVTFAKWYTNNNVEGWHMDKDLLSTENKIYSPETCCFIPLVINSSIGAGVNIKEDNNGFFFFDTSFNFSTRKIYGMNYEDAYRLCVIYRQTHIKTLVSIYWRQMSDKVKEKLIHLYDDKEGQIFKGSGASKREGR